MQFYFSCYVRYDDFLAYYQGAVNKVEVTDNAGRVLHINAKYFKPYLTRDGIRGHFCLQTDSNGNFISLTQV
ncbi:DUF2835 domain-containing protein [Shewanella sp. WXL01]|uniref:DUF2835 family protein n=1 Tax=Shewanella maritima TaxID=2520507 RepID=A0A411PM20_9GAMM|nr:MULTISPECIES: DUF2835 domain-containing protein [Shewanella]NKF51494.1 DUF2835 domain-containing protein [Shewanella sp. WXL01]QBF84576.1 DUF2835 family protein [Shewanella maritima]